MPLNSIEQARAAFAWECAESKSKEYGRQVNKVPTYIKTNGLLNTMAFFYSKQGEGKGDVLKDICRWLTGDSQPNSYKIFPLIEKNKLPEGKNLEEQVLNYLLNIQTSNARFIIQCTSEVLALMNWSRRFAKSE
jgi:CRISPR type III-B/RAMP module-associated protein Cmr5